MEENIRSRKKRFLSLTSKGPMSGDVFEDIVDWPLSHSYLTVEAEKLDIYFPNIHCTQRQPCDLVLDHKIVEDVLAACSALLYWDNVPVAPCCELPSAKGSVLAWK